MTSEVNWHRYPLASATPAKLSLLHEIKDLKDQHFNSTEAIKICRDYRRNVNILDRACSLIRASRNEAASLEIGTVRHICNVADRVLVNKLYREMLQASNEDNWLVAYLASKDRDKLFVVDIDYPRLVSEFVVKLAQVSVKKPGNDQPTELLLGDPLIADSTSKQLSKKQRAFVHALGRVLGQGGALVSCEITGRIHDARFLVDDLLSVQHKDLIYEHVGRITAVKQKADEGHGFIVSAVKQEDFNGVIKQLISAISFYPQPYYTHFIELYPMYKRLKSENKHLEDGHEKMMAIHFMNVFQLDHNDVQQRLPEVIKETKRLALDFSMDIRRQNCLDDKTRKELCDLLVYEKYVANILEKHKNFLIKYCLA